MYLFENFYCELGTLQSKLLGILIYELPLLLHSNEKQWIEDEHEVIFVHRGKYKLANIATLAESWISHSETSGSKFTFRFLQSLHLYIPNIENENAGFYDTINEICYSEFQCS